MAPDRDPFNDKRGTTQSEGWWLTADEALQDSVGHTAWWKEELLGKSVSITANSECPGKPFWKYENGDIYLGGWKRNEKGIMVEHGFGIMYNHAPQKCTGMCFIGDWKDGAINGFGKTWWIEASYTWRKNYLPASPIRQKEAGGKLKSRPFIYTGNFLNDCRSDNEGATVTLKDGTTRVGRWDDHKPVGNWWTDHKPLPVAVSELGRDSNLLGAERMERQASVIRKKLFAFSYPQTRSKDKYETKKSTCCKSPAEQERDPSLEWWRFF